MRKALEIKPKYQHSKVGQFLFNLSARFTMFVVKCRPLYYILACTWGILMTTLGLLISLVLLPVSWFKKARYHKFHWLYFIKVGPKYWGGCEMGLMFLRDWESDDSYINNHEFGHTFQNCILGPLFPFMVAIPSATRYWLREWFPKKDWNDYDSVWFEDAATQCGKWAAGYLDKKKGTKSDGKVNKK